VQAFVPERLRKIHVDKRGATIAALRSSTSTTAIARYAREELADVIAETEAENYE
jgi:hypothetical protein